LRDHDSDGSRLRHQTKLPGSALGLAIGLLPAANPQKERASSGGGMAVFLTISHKKTRRLPAGFDFDKAN
jgi:hypothetical protein